MPRPELRTFAIDSAGEFRDFIRFPFRLYRGDPHWIPPLIHERRNFLHPDKNPFYRHGTVRLFLAKRGEDVRGRISAHIDHRYEKAQGERVGFFGFFECEDDTETSRALLGRAEDFLKSQGCSKVLGPFNFSINQECGLLVEGFTEPLMTLTPYNPPYYLQLLENLGYRKAKDLLAWRYDVAEIPEAPVAIAKAAARAPGLVVRNFNPKAALADTRVIFEVFNSAWAGNWGFVAMSEEEIRRIAEELRRHTDPRYIFIAEIHGKPAAACLSVPNLFELIYDLRGRLLPLGFLKFYWRLKRSTYQSIRVMLLGVKEEYRRFALGGLGILLNVKVAQAAQAAGLKFGELSWTLEDNDAISAGIEFMGGKRVKVFRIFEKSMA